MSFFTPLIGQTQAVELLMQAVTKNRIAPAYLFAGTDGIGRALAARCFTEVLFSHDATAQKRLQQGNHPDLLWVQPTYQHQGQRLTPQEAAEKGLKRKAPPVIRLEQIREITEFLSRPAMLAPRSVVVIEQAETMAEGAANALLKTLEEPGRATLILIAPSADAILPTLVSRCQKVPFYRLDVANMAEVLNRTGNGEILQHPAVINLAAGSPGNAIASYQQMQAIPGELLQALQKTPANQRQALELARRIDKELDTEGQLWLVDYLQQLYWQQQYKSNIVKQLEKTRKHLLCYAQPRLVWECTLLGIT
ncbi:MAG: DNA polymerase III subunit delta' [Methylacidiphilales bacterium]|nr:DNA polymerase III subunit delta' [Candidatus Methylacidiphilales bacterium]NJR17853.1 DNA polymerase III subunit delta' [Calothrix sp. CSU_2_0]